MATWEQVKKNPTFFSHALFKGEGEHIRWHTNADRPHSSQVFCVSAFGTLRKLIGKNKVVDQLVGFKDLLLKGSREWTIQLEAENREILAEYGNVQASSVDCLFRCENAVYCLESKFLSDALVGFGGCSQPKKNCAGYYGPGSDQKTKTNSWCRLEIWEGNRSPRSYWALGKSYFQESVYSKQSRGQECPFKGSNFQLMRNFLFAASMAQRNHLSSYGVITMVPEKKMGKLREQINDFQKNILQPDFEGCIQLVSYENYIQILNETGEEDAVKLAEFLLSKIKTLIY